METRIRKHILFKILLKREADTITDTYTSQIPMTERVTYSTQPPLHQHETFSL